MNKKTTSTTSNRRGASGNAKSDASARWHALKAKDKRLKSRKGKFDIFDLCPLGTSKEAKECYAISRNYLETSSNLFAAIAKTFWKGLVMLVKGR